MKTSFTISAPLLLVAGAATAAAASSSGPKIMKPVFIFVPLAV